MKGFLQAIKDHQEKMAAQDEAFAEKYAAKCEAEQDSIANCCKYWQKTDTLLMSARDKEGKRLESIEVNLRDYKVLQSRGLQNQPTEQHDAIVALVKKNMRQIKTIRNQAI